MIRFVQIETTTRCNYQCAFCAGRHLPQQDLSITDVVALLPNLGQLEHVQVQGEGESLLHPEFFDLIRTLSSHQPGLKISLTTNGSLLSQDKAELLVNAGLHTVLVSLETANPDQFQRLRGGRLAQVKAGIQRLLAIRRRQQKERPRVGLAVTLLNACYAELPAIANLHDELGMDGGIFPQLLQSMPAYRRYYPRDIDAAIMTPEHIATTKRLINEQPRLRQQIDLAKTAEDFHSALHRQYGQQGQRCPWLMAGVYLHADGTLSSCCYIKDPATYGLAQAKAPEGLAQLDAAKQQLSTQLLAGQVPEQCQGCAIARQVVRRNTPAPPSVVAIPEQPLGKQPMGVDP